LLGGESYGELRPTVQHADIPLLKSATQGHHLVTHELQLSTPNYRR